MTKWDMMLCIIAAMTLFGLSIEFELIHEAAAAAAYRQK